MSSNPNQKRRPLRTKRGLWIEVLESRDLLSGLAIGTIVDPPAKALEAVRSSLRGAAVAGADLYVFGDTGYNRVSLGPAIAFHPQTSLPSLESYPSLPADPLTVQVRGVTHINDVVGFVGWGNAPEATQGATALHPEGIVWGPSGVPSGIGFADQDGPTMT